MNIRFKVFASYNILQYLCDFIHVLIFGTVSKCRKSPKLTNIVFVVDIWDCSRMHITVMNEASTNGHRHMCFGAVGKCADVGLMIREQYDDQLGPNPSTQVMSTPVCVVI
jgi:hypothetical protein